MGKNGGAASERILMANPAFVEIRPKSVWVGGRDQLGRQYVKYEISASPDVREEQEQKVEVRDYRPKVLRLAQKLKPNRLQPIDERLFKEIQKNAFVQLVTVGKDFPYYRLDLRSMNGDPPVSLLTETIFLSPKGEACTFDVKTQGKKAWLFNSAYDFPCHLKRLLISFTDDLNKIVFSFSNYHRRVSVVTEIGKKKEIRSIT